ncbi:MAG: ABC transporter substrate-binding protein, partial [Clostridia bacterium]|nr:ABC transporter substrate-binding protein [Clostridia bacterium]
GTDVVINYDIQYDLITAAFEGGIGDYCTMFEPAATVFQNAGKGYIKEAVGPQCGEIPYTAFCATKGYLKANENKVKAFLRALQKGVDYVRDNTPEKVAQAVAPSFVGVDYEVLVSAIRNYKNIGAYVTDMHLSKESFERLQDVIIEAGIMTKRATYSDVVNHGYLG